MSNLRQIAALALLASMGSTTFARAARGDIEPEPTPTDDSETKRRHAERMERAQAHMRHDPTAPPTPKVHSHAREIARRKRQAERVAAKAEKPDA